VIQLKLVLAWWQQMICCLAAFPYEAFKNISSPVARVRVTAHGITIVISTVTLTFALHRTGTSLVGPILALYAIPVVTSCYDRVLYTLCYQRQRRSGWLIAGRMLILLISMFLAFFASISSESENLLKNLHKAEDAQTMATNEEAKELNQRLNALEKKITEYTNKTISINEVKEKINKSYRLEKKEIDGERGYDMESETNIIGGGNGPKARGHKIDAESGEKELKLIEEIKDKTLPDLEKQVKTLKEDIENHLQKYRSPPGIGTLVRALKEADAGILVKIIGIFIFILVAEGAPLFLSSIPVSDRLHQAVTNMEDEDRRRLAASHEKEIANIERMRFLARAEIADTIAPIEVTLTTASNSEPWGLGKDAAQ